MPAETAQQVAMTMDANTVTTIISNINSLYSNALNQIIALTVGMLALGGVALPLILSHFQKKKAAIEYEALTNKIAAEIEAAKAVVALDLSKEFENEKQKFEERIAELQKTFEVKIEKIQAGANAKTHHHIAVTISNNGQYQDALKQCSLAVCDYVKAGDEYNLQIVVNNNLIAAILPKLKKADFDKNEKLGVALSNMITAIKAINTNGRYALMLDALDEAYKAAQERTF